MSVLECGVYMASFKERFLYLKVEKGVSFKEIAEAVNSNRTSISRMVNGELNIKKDLIEALSKYFNVDQAYLLGESNNRKNTEVIPQDYVEVYKHAMDKKVPSKVLHDFIELWTKKE